MPKISDLPGAATLTGAELFPVVQGGVTSQAELSAVAAFAQDGSDLDAADPLDGTEIVTVVQDGSPVQTTTQDIADLAGGGGVVLHQRWQVSVSGGVVVAFEAHALPGNTQALALIADTETAGGGTVFRVNTSGVTWLPMALGAVLAFDPGGPATAYRLATEGSANRVNIYMYDDLLGDPTDIAVFTVDVHLSA